MHLIDIPDNPVPPDPVVGTLRTHDDARLRFARWEAEARPAKGTVCLLPGRAEYIEKYFETIGDLRRRGFAVAALDWRGQGGSSRLLNRREKGHIDSFDQFDTDLATFMTQIVLPDCTPPIHVLAHSMGGNVVLRAATRRPAWFDRVVLSAPLIRLDEHQMPGRAVRTFVEAACFFGFGNATVPRQPSAAHYTPFEGNPFTSDPVRYARALGVVEAAPELGIEAPTFGWVLAALNSMDMVGAPEFAARIGVPVLMVGGGHDRVVSNAAIETLAYRLKAGSHIVIPGARHELMMERDIYREPFLAAFDAFVPGSPAYA